MWPSQTNLPIIKITLRMLASILKVMPLGLLTHEDTDDISSTDFGPGVQLTDYLV
jgi:hypothetical protein